MASRDSPILPRTARLNRRDPVQAHINFTDPQANDIRVKTLDGRLLKMFLGGEFA
jgi:hypothetical protein